MLLKKIFALAFKGNQLFIKTQFMLFWFINPSNNAGKKSEKNFFFFIFFKIKSNQNYVYKKSV